MEQKTITLYHFTSLILLCKILDDGGLSKGDVPITWDTGYRAVWFTTTSSITSQENMLKGSNVDKTEVRITVEFSLPTPKLYYWRDIASKIGVDRKVYRELDKSANYGAKTWWIYPGTVPIEKFKAVEYRASKEAPYLPLDIKGELVEKNMEAAKKMSLEMIMEVTYFPFPDI
jgi:hypothetical protein